MSATEEEIAWAVAIKQAVEKDESLAPITDLECIQHAIVAKEKVKKALVRIKRMQKFKEHYGIPQQESPEQYKDACESLRGMLEQQAGMMAGVGVDAKGRYVCVMEYSKFEPSILKTKQDWNTMMKGFYYNFVALQPTVEAIREGVVFLADCKDMGWHNFSLEAEKRAAEFYSDCFPMRISEMVMLNAPGILRIMYGMCKIFISKKIRETIVITANDKYVEDNTDIFPQDILPLCLGGKCTEAMVLDRLETNLKTRLQCAASFTL